MGGCSSKCWESADVVGPQPLDITVKEIDAMGLSRAASDDIPSMELQAQTNKQNISTSFQVSVATGHLHVKLSRRQRHKIAAAQSQLSRIPSDRVLLALGLEVKEDTGDAYYNDNDDDDDDSEEFILALKGGGQPSESPEQKRRPSLSFLEDARDHAMLEETVFSSVASRVSGYDSDDNRSRTSTIKTVESWRSGKETSSVTGSIFEGEEEILAKIEHVKRRRVTRGKSKQQRKAAMAKRRQSEEASDEKQGVEMHFSPLPEVGVVSMPVRMIDFPPLASTGVTTSQEDGENDEMPEKNSHDITKRESSSQRSSPSVTSGDNINKDIISEERDTKSRPEESKTDCKADSPERQSASASMPPRRSRRSTLLVPNDVAQPPKTPTARVDRRRFVSVASPRIRKLPVAMKDIKSPEVSESVYDSNYMTPNQAKELLKWSITDLSPLTPAPEKDEIQIPAGTGPWFFEDLGEFPAFRRLCVKLRKKLNLDPWDNCKTFEDTEIKDFIQSYPWTCRVRYQFDHFTGDLLPFPILCTMKADVSTMEAAFEAYPDAILECDAWIGTPLHYACSYQANKLVLKFLVKKNSSMLEKTNQFGRTPLHQACIFKTPAKLIIPLIKLFPEAVEMHDERDGYTPLHLACENGASAEVINALLRVNPGATGIAPTTAKEYVPLHIACLMAQGNHDVIATLLKGCPEATEYLDFAGNLPLHLAAQSGASQKTIESLVGRYPESINLQNDMGQTAFRIAKRQSMLDAVLDILSP